MLIKSLPFPKASPRSGFTLIELLVVIAISSKSAGGSAGAYQALGIGMNHPEIGKTLALTNYANWTPIRQSDLMHPSETLVIGD